MGVSTSRWSVLKDRDTSVNFSYLRAVRDALDRNSLFDITHNRCLNTPSESHKAVKYHCESTDRNEN